MGKSGKNSIQGAKVLPPKILNNYKKKIITVRGGSGGHHP